MRKLLLRAIVVVFAVAACLYVLFLGALWAVQDKLLFGRSTHDVVETPLARQWPFEHVTVEVAGEKTQGWWLPVENARGAVLFSHGSGRNISCYLEDAAFFRDLGFSVLVYDYGGYGSSTGRYGEARCCADARAMWDYLVQTRKIPSEKIVLAGCSLGGGVTADLASRVSPAAVILESTFTSVPDTVSDMMPYVPQFVCRIQFRSIDKVGGFKCPVLVIHSKDDTVVPFAHSQRLLDRIAAPKMFVEIHGAHHGGKFASSDAYAAGLKTFFDSVFKQ